jgi:hypothetical protein
MAKYFLVMAFLKVRADEVCVATDSAIDDLNGRYYVG